MSPPSDTNAHFGVLTQACDRCHTRKTRCDRRTPRCSHCERADVPCVFSDKSRKRNYSRGFVDDMQSHIGDLERRNVELTRKLARLGEPDRGRQGQGQSQGSFDDTSTNQVVETSPQPAGSQTTGCTTSSAPLTSPPLIREEDGISGVMDYLTLRATGETHYLGPSGGGELAKMVGTVIDSASLRPQLSWTQPSSSCSEIDLTEEISYPSTEPHGENPLPDRSTAAKIISIYFAHNHLTFPLLHGPTFLDTVNKMYMDPTYYQNHPFEAFTFDMVIALATANANHFECCSAGADKYYSRAMEKLSIVLQMSGLAPVQAIVFVAQYGVMCHLKRNVTSMWHVVGIGARFCLEMGLHRESRHGRTFDPVAPQSAFDLEMRRRCFWCFYNLDRIVSITLGRPVSIDDDVIDVPLPLHILDEDYFGPNGLESGRAIHGTSRKPLTSPFLHLVRIRKLLGAISGALMSAKNAARSIEEKLQIRSNLHQELVRWREDIPSSEMLGEMCTSRSPVSRFLTNDWYHVLYHNAILILHGPSPMFPGDLGSADAPGENTLLLLRSAKAVINLNSKLHRHRQLDYSWITLKAIFLGGITYIYAIGALLKKWKASLQKRSVSHKDMTFVPATIDIIADVRACSNILLAVSERRPAARTFCEVFERLSNAVIGDSITLMLEAQRHATAAPAAHLAQPTPSLCGQSFESDGADGLGGSNAPVASISSPTGVGYADAPDFRCNYEGLETTLQDPSLMFQFNNEACPEFWIDWFTESNGQLDEQLLFNGPDFQALQELI
ncbi:putative Fungal specific transcription factor [Fonsecaea pedrosoi]|nr:putative Fungal specific transcription factor [Fonsecaea pedrosoi]